ncbi:DUF5994 family protein [Mycobacterium sp. SMC-4]|uniref:DUF5994 family protein n=1 Tax=Mycobacterium sp. SMC-4 TaxID=2857059 RepID=UPI0021B2A67A|nr:DUF5994 family protein [Mycobacterium sp. SMC-4]UXA18764.1 hypothetical protein KXD98_03420 [Mycobacterium sp. SMC-4]
MVRTTITSDTSTREGGPENTPRLRLKRKAVRTGQVDGAWWPHSDDLAGELPDLLAVLAVRIGAATRVTYNLAEWAVPARKVRIGGGVVRLDGYVRQPFHTIGITGSRGDEILLLVVPTGSDPEHAHSAMMTAATPEDVSDVGTLLAT